MISPAQVPKTGKPPLMRSCSGSRSPEDLGAIVGVDLRDPGFWERGLDLVQRRLEAAEEAARAL